MLDEARGFLDDVVALRRSIHREPELGLELPRTQAKVLHALNGLPLDIRTGQRTTSVVADLRGCAPGRTIILRADMDALPLQEDTDVPFKSTIAGRMHACGHDAHTAMLVGAVRLLLRHQADFAGTVRFMFQPGEEGYAGARVMLEEGLLAAPADGSEAPSAAFALHATPRWQTGTVLTRPGPVLASTDNFTIVVSGRGGHASAPHMAADPVPVACEIVMALQTFVTRSVNIFTPGVVTVGRIEAGTASNIVPEVATLRGTIRTLSAETRSLVVSGVKRVADGVCAAHGVSASVNVDPGYPVTVNDADFARLVLSVGEEMLGAECAIEQPTPQMAGEDFAYVLEKIPGAMSSLGSRPVGFGEGEAPNAHSNRYVLNEDALPIGVAMNAAVALASLRGDRATP